MLELHDISVRLGGRRRVKHVSLTLQPGEVMGIIGPNGAGKSTLIKAISGERPAETGYFLVNGQARPAQCRKHLARILSVMGQTPTVAFDFTVQELVTLGRVPHRGRDTAEDQRAIVDQAIDLAGLSGFSDRSVPSLSGGERQRAFYAKAVAQLMPSQSRLPGEGTLLLLDEPTSALDLAQQLRVMTSVRQIAKAGGAVMVVIHDLNLALSFTDRLAVMKDGALCALGTTREIVTEESVAHWYDCPVRILTGSQRDDRAVAIRTDPDRSI